MKKLLILLLLLILPLPAAAEHIPLEKGIPYYDWVIACPSDYLHEFVKNMRAVKTTLGKDTLVPFVRSSECNIHIIDFEVDQYICSYTGGTMDMAVVRAVVKSVSVIIIIHYPEIPLRVECK